MKVDRGYHEALCAFGSFGEPVLAPIAVPTWFSAKRKRFGWLGEDHKRVCGTAIKVYICYHEALSAVGYFGEPVPDPIPAPAWFVVV